MIRYIFVAFIALAASSANASDLPDATRTPGVTNPDIAQANIARTICNNHGPGKHWTTKLVRPPVGYTNKLKRKQIAEMHLGGKMADFEEDHLIPLTLGGHPRDPRNLWPQPWDGKYGAHVKDKLENKLHTLVCNGSLSLAEAQKAIAQDWVGAYRKYVE